MEAQGLQQQEQGQRPQLVQDLVSPGAVQYTDPAQQGQGAEIQKGAQCEIHGPGPKSPPGKDGLGRRVLPPGEGGPLRLVHAVQIGGGVQGVIPDMVLPHGPADPGGLAQLRPLGGQGGQPSLQGGLQVQLPRLEGPDLLQGEPHLPQQLDLQQGIQILLPVVPVAVLPPGGMNEPLALIVADIGPGQSGALLHLFDGHRGRPPFLFCPHCKG